ncbi:MAG: hypothetical protein DI548_07440 [Flavobacterium johnsoniae]|nr:MAG: hypothetical protein DI548_07440 [Flavobacterium johnsoniae]
MIPLFFYRMTNLLRKNHVFNYLFIRFFIYITCYTMPAILTPVLVLITINKSNQAVLKHDAIEQYGFFSKKLNMSARDLLIIDNRTVSFRLTLFLGLCGLLILFTLSISYTNIIFYVLKQQSDVIAEATRKMHRKCTVALVYQVGKEHPIFDHYEEVDFLIDRHN